MLRVLRGAAARFVVHGLVEYDVSTAAVKLTVGDPNPKASWSGFIIASVGRAVAAHPEVNARLAGRHILSFHSVDLRATVERDTPDGPAPVDVVIPDADRVSPSHITELLRTAKTGPPPAPAAVTRFARLPAPLRRAGMRFASSRPAVAAGYGPAVGVTSLGMFAPPGGWAIPIAPLTLVVTAGHVADRAVVRDGTVVVRQMLPLTVSFDHAVVDGAPAARFTQTLGQVLETAAAFDTPTW